MISTLLRSVSLCLSAALFVGCVTQTDVSNSTDPAVVRPHYKRPNLLVTDLERSLTLYRDVLGFEAATIGTSGADSYSYPVFNIPTTATMRYSYLGEPGEARVFGLTEVSGVEMEAVSSAPYRTGHVIGVTDINGKLAQIEAMGLSATEPKDAGGTDFRFREVAFTDFDGHLIVLYEVLP